MVKNFRTVFRVMSKNRAKSPTGKEESKMNARVLTIDDSHATLDLFTAALWSYGCQIDRARDGLEAFGMVTSNLYDLIIMDIDMPVMNGLEFYKEHVQNVQAMSDRVIFTSLHLDSKNRFFINLNGCKYLQKPFRIVELFKVVDEVLGGLNALSPDPSTDKGGTGWTS